MNHFAPSRIRVEKDIITRVARALSGKGQLRVKVGQEVTPDEIIGTNSIASGFRTINLSRELKVTGREAEKYLTRPLGQRIYKGELLAHKKRGFLSRERVITSPTDGILDFLNTKNGELKISFLPKRADLPAGMYGIIEEVDNERGLVVIRTQVSRVHGIIGSGRVREGILHILGKKEDLTGKDVLSKSYQEYILVGGSLFFKDAISAAISLGVSGLISGGINVQDYKAMMSGGRLIFPRKLENDIGISVVICEGFGVVPMGDDIFKTLSDYEGRFIFIDGNKAQINLPSFSSSSLVQIRNTHLPKERREELMGTVELKAGMKVRIIGNSYCGEQGKILAIDDSQTLLPSKVRTYLATVETSRRKIQVPVANIEAIV